MSEASSTIRGSIMIADFVNSDPSGKINVIGGGLSLIGWDANTGVTAPFSVLAILISPMALPEPVAVELLLADAAGEVVQMPTPVPGEGQALRVAQNVPFTAPVVPGVVLPPGALEATAQIALNFSSGLPLPVGQSFTWRLQVDHDTIASVAFYIPGPIQGPVLG